MKKLGIFAMALATLAFVACDDKKNNTVDLNTLPNGFYVNVAGAALSAENAMEQGINEVDQTARTGMYEKYVVLTEGTVYQFVNKKGSNADNWGADLTYDEMMIITDNHEIAGYKGSLVANGSFSVTKTDLYHIVLDFNEDGLLADVGGAQCIIVPVEWGVRGGMNSWGFTAGARTENDGVITWTWKDQELAAGGEFKFAHNDCWKIELDIAKLVKANTNLGKNCLPGGDNIAVDTAGLYDITLTYAANEESSAIADSYTMTVTLTQESNLPTTMYMIGNYCGWDWNNATTMVPVHSHGGSFWTVCYLVAGEGFKFCAQKAWNGDFCELAGENVGFDVDGNNCVVATSGLYRAEVDIKNGNVYVEPAEVYGIGDCFGGWNEGEYPFTPDAEKTSITVPNTGNLRMYVKLHNNPGNWWQSEFNIYDGEIVYRADGGDQPAVAVTAGSVVELDFNAGTGAIE